MQGAIQLRAGGTALVSRRYHLRIAASKGAVPTGRIESLTAIDDSGVDLSIRLRAQSPDLCVAEAVLRGASGGALQWSFESLSMAASGGARLEADISPED